jgi:hypothetical protein
MMPGVYLFRMMSGLVQITAGVETTLGLIAETISAGMTALIIILAMSLGLIIPKMIIDHVGSRTTLTKTMQTTEHVNAR